MCDTREPNSEQERDNEEEYRRPPYMREDEERTRYEQDRPREDRYGYDRERSEEERIPYEQNRYGYDEPVRQKRDKRSGKKNSHFVVIIVLVALLLGTLVAGICWSIGRLLGTMGGSGNSGEGWKIPETTAEAQETEPAKDAEDGPILSVPGDAKLPTAPSAEVAEDSVLITDIPDVVDMCMPSIVAITTKYVYENYNNYGYNPFFYYYGGGNNNPSTYETTGAGSGIIIGDDGEELWVVTNNHVVADSNEVKVSFNDGTDVSAYIKGTDAENDLAVVGVKLADLKSETRAAIRAIQMGDSDSLRLGETVIAIGNALGIGQSVTTGIVSALNRTITTEEKVSLTTIQTDAAINPGNSGGALLNSKGQLIGINVAKDVEQNVEGMGYAIPISNAIDIIQKLTTMTPRTAVADEEYPYLGVQLKDIDSAYAAAYNIPTGILVYTVEANGPAEKAGMLTQDIITKFNGVTVAGYNDLKDELKYCAGGTTVVVTISRIENGAYVEKELTVTLGLKSDYVKEESTEETPVDRGSSNGGRNPFGFQFP